MYSNSEVLSFINNRRITVNAGLADLFGKQILTARFVGVEIVLQWNTDATPSSCDYGFVDITVAAVIDHLTSDLEDEDSEDNLDKLQQELEEVFNGLRILFTLTDERGEMIGSGVTTNFLYTQIFMPEWGN